MKLEAAGCPHFVAAQEALLVLDDVQLRPFTEHRVHYNVLRGRGPRRCDECPSVNGHARYLGPQVEGSPDWSRCFHVNQFTSCTQAELHFGSAKFVREKYAYLAVVAFRRSTMLTWPSLDPLTMWPT